MARCILALALCFTFAVPFVRSRRVSHDSKVASADAAPPPQDTIFVNGFEFGTDEEALKKHFGAVGAIKDLHLQSRGAALITYKKPSAATRAVNELHETTLKGQSRYVEVKLDDPERQPKGAKAKGKDKGKLEDLEQPKGAKAEGKDKGKTEDSVERHPRPSGRTIFVYGFDPKTDDDALLDHFGTVGAIQHHHFQTKVSAVIVYAKKSAAQEALAKLDGSTMSGQRRYVDVRLDIPEEN